MADHLAPATERLITTVAALPDPDWVARSVCDGWSRAHVIAHLALNAEGLAGALRGVIDDVPAPMYASTEARAADIETLAMQSPATIRDRVRSSAAALAAAIADLPEHKGEVRYERTPGGITIPAGRVPFLRLREVEIHHADLLLGYSWSDWPTDTAVAFLSHDAARYDGTPPFTVRAVDLGRSWAFGRPGPDSPVVSGPVAALAWWATGRDPGDALTSADDRLPVMEGR